DERASDEVISRMAGDWDAGGKRDRYLVFRPEAALPVDTLVSVSVGPGTPSAEGPRVTDKAQEFSFRTFGPMKIVDQNCSGTDRCPPFSSFYVETSNPVDTAKFEKGMVRVE